METGHIRNASLIAQLQYSGSMSRTSMVGDGSENRVATLTATDSFELSIEVDAGFVERVLRGALEDSLDDALADAGIESTAEELLASDQDYSPEATAARIVEFAVGFYAQYQGADADAAEDGGVEGFVDLVKGAVAEGFASARTTLEGFQEMDDELWGNLERTQTLTMEGIDAFAESTSDAEAAADATSAL